MKAATRAVFPFWFCVLVLVAQLPVQGEVGKGTEKKQIILFSFDDFRGDHLNAYGYSRDTSPCLSALAKDAAYYKNAYPNGNWTIPSHISLLTGMLPSRHGVNQGSSAYQDKKGAGLSDSIQTLAEVFHAMKVKTLKASYLPAALGFNRGFDLVMSADPFGDEKRFGRLLKMIGDHKNGDFFLFIHTGMAHAPYTYSRFLGRDRLSAEKRKKIDGFRDMHRGKSNIDLVSAFNAYLKEADLFNADDCQALYDGGIRYVDGYIGRLVESLKALGIYDRAMFVMVSDHGEHFGEHYPAEFCNHHGQDFYEEFLKIPLIFKYPHTAAREVIADPASMIDVMPTILDYYGIAFPPYIQGESLWRKKRRDRVIVAEATILGKGVERKMILSGGFKYIITMQDTDPRFRINWKKVSERRLFHLPSDPREKTDLSKNPKYIQTGNRLEKMLKEIIRQSAAANFKRKEGVMDKKTLELLKTLGYL